MRPAGRGRRLSLELEAQDLPGLSHGHSPVGHRALLVVFEESPGGHVHAPLLKAGYSFHAGLTNCSAWRGIAVRLALESLFGLPWNDCSAWRGIRTIGL